MTPERTPVGLLIHTYTAMKPFAYLLFLLVVLCPTAPLVWVAKRACMQALLLTTSGGRLARTEAEWRRSCDRCWKLAAAVAHGAAAVLHLAFAALFVRQLFEEHGGRPSTRNRWKPSAVVCSESFMEDAPWRTFVLSAYVLFRAFMLLVQSTAPTARAPTRRTSRLTSGLWFLLLWELVARQSGLTLPTALVDAADKAVSHTLRAAANAARESEPATSRPLMLVHRNVLRPLLLLWLLAHAAEAFRARCGNDVGGAAFAVVLVLGTLLARLGWLCVDALVTGGGSVFRLHVKAADLGREFQRRSEKEHAA